MSCNVLSKYTSISYTHPTDHSIAQNGSNVHTAQRGRKRCQPEASCKLRYEVAMARACRKLQAIQELHEALAVAGRWEVA